MDQNTAPDDGESKTAAEAGKAAGGSWLRLLPLLAFGALCVVFLIRLFTVGDTSTVPSALIGKPVPTFSMEAVAGLSNGGEPVPGFSTKDLTNKDKPTIVNVWASWCTPCRAEHPLLMELAQDTRFTIVGINNKDQPGNAVRFLGALGNPFSMVGADPKGRTAIEWGVYGIPETFIVSKDGVIVYKQVGPLDPINIKAFKNEMEKAL